MARKPKAPPPLLLPVLGKVMGGRLNGWHFLFLKFVIVGNKVRIFARMNPPAWPFPRDFVLKPDYFHQIVADREDKRSINVDREIQAVYQAANVAMPEGADRPKWLQ